MEYKVLIGDTLVRIGSTDIPSNAEEMFDTITVVPFVAHNQLIWYSDGAPKILYSTTNDFSRS